MTGQDLMRNSTVTVKYGYYPRQQSQTPKQFCGHSHKTMEYKKVNIEGFDGMYQIDTNGIVYSLPRRGKFGRGYRDFPGGVLKYRIRNGYPFITIKVGKVYHNLYIHRLLGQYFIPNPNNYSQINHKDGNRSNFRLDNLEWCSQSMNNHHAVNVLGKKNIKHVKCNETGQVFTSVNKASIYFQGSRRNLQQHLLGQRNSFKKHTFSYL